MTLDEAIEQQKAVNEKSRYSDMCGQAEAPNTQRLYSVGTQLKQTSLRERLINEAAGMRERYEMLTKAFAMLEENPEYEKQKSLTEALSQLGIY